jgi:hypothetical protein
MATHQTRERLDQVYSLIETTARCTKDQKVSRPYGWFEGLSLVDIKQIADVLAHDGYIVTQEAGVLTVDWGRSV